MRHDDIINSIELADVDRDGWLDIAAGANDLFLCLNIHPMQPGMQRVFVKDILENNPFSSAYLTVGDYNNDGNMDIWSISSSEYFWLLGFMISNKWYYDIE